MVRRPLRSASPSGVLPHRSSTLTSASYLQGGHHEQVATLRPALAVTVSPFLHSRLVSYPPDALRACKHPSPHLIATPLFNKVAAAQLWQLGVWLWSGSINLPPSVALHPH